MEMSFPMGHGNLKVKARHKQGGAAEQIMGGRKVGVLNLFVDIHADECVGEVGAS